MGVWPRDSRMSGRGCRRGIPQRAPRDPRQHRAKHRRHLSARGVSREAAIADYGVVPTAELDDDWVSYDAAATDTEDGSRPTPAEVFSGRGPGYARLCGGVSYADDVVGS